MPPIELAGGIFAHPRGKPQSSGQNWLFTFQLVARRYEQGSIILTSNKAFVEWGAVLGDGVIASAILDRLLHHSTVFNIRGDSYRLREKREALSGEEVMQPETD